MKIAPAGARRFLSAPDKSVRAVLVYGPNRALVTEAAQTLVKHALGGTDDPFALTRLHEDELRKDKAKLSDALAAQSLLGGPRVIWLRADGETQSDVMIEGLAAVAGDDGAFFIIEGGEFSTKGKTVAAYEAASHAAAIAFYEESEAERAAFLKALIDSERIPMSADAREVFVAHAPSDRALARGELEKVALFAHDLGRQVEPADLAALAAVEAEGELDDATNAAASGRISLALDMLDRLDGSNGVSLLKALERKMLRLLEARTLVDGGVAPNDAGDRLKPKVFWKERDLFASQVRMWTTPRVLSALEVLWAAELRAKTAGAPQDVIAAGAYRRVAEIASAGR
jgi:DNA polymerase III subunit delta